MMVIPVVEQELTPPWRCHMGLLAVVSVVSVVEQELLPLWRCHLGLLAVASVVDDRLKFLWQGHLASLVIGIES